jgi:FixJ family two-component response regulator
MAETLDTVIVIDDDAGIRQALGKLLRSVGLQATLHGSVPEFLNAKRPDGPSCLVLDVRLPGKSGLDFQRELKNEGIELPIVFITGHGDIPMSVQAIKGGAVEFLTKPFRDQDLLDAIAQALEQDRSLRRARSGMAALRGRFRTLTERECQVMNLVVAGKLNKEIAAELGTSEITIKVHRSHVMQKMQADSLADLVRMAAKLETLP